METFTPKKEINNEPHFESEEDEDDCNERMEVELTCVKKENDTKADLYAEDVEVKKEVWFDKVKPIVDHIRDMNVCLMWVL